jgi:hypothetical protein
MASMLYTNALKLLMNGGLDLDTHDIRVMLLMSNTTADTDQDNITNISAIGTLDECDASGYARVALTGEAVTEDTTDNEAVFDANDASFTGLGGNATRAIQGALIYRHVDGTAGNDVPIMFVDFSSDIPATATQIDVPWAAEGILNAAQG